MVSGFRGRLFHIQHTILIYCSAQLSVHTACEVLMRDLLRCGADPSPAVSQRAAMVENMLEHLFNFEVELMVHFPARRVYSFDLLLL